MMRARFGGRAARSAAAALAALVAIVAVGVLPAGAPGAAATAAAASTGLSTTADARYVVDPDAHRVHVTVALAATNRLKDTKTHRYFFDRLYLAVQPGVVNLKVTSGGAKPTVGVQARKTTYTLLRVDFGKQLAAGASRTFTLTFDIRDPGGAPTRAIRIGTSLVTFSAWGFGSDGVTGGSVNVVFPPGFTIDVSAPGLRAATTDAGGNTVYATGQLANPLAFSAAFVADRPSAFRESTIKVAIDGQTIPVTIRAWPDDPTWATRVGRLLQRGLPALSAAIGLPWKADQPLIVEEAVSRSTTGFAGRFNPPAGRIEIAYYADSFVILHEAAHAWFDGGLLADRWASEGFASWYAIRVAAAIGEKKVAGTALTPALAASRVPLNAWGPPATDGSAAETAEYAASQKLAGLIADRVGADGLRSIWQAINDRRAAYQPATGPAGVERTDAAPDWRGLLDLLEEQTGTSFDDLWSTWVVRPSDAGLLADRRALRVRYAAIVARAGSWQLPRSVRDALGAWQYGQATELLDAASRALDDRDAVGAAAAAAGLTPPPTMQLDFEGPRGFAAASAEAEAELAAIAADRAAAGARLGNPDLVASIGLWNADPGAALGRAAASFAAGDLRATVEASAIARITWQSAADTGRNRILAVTASLAAILLGSWLALRWYRDRGVRRPLVTDP